MATAKRAERLCGAAFEEGREDDLLARQGEYYKLHRMQFKNGG